MYKSNKKTKIVNIFGRFIGIGYDVDPNSPRKNGVGFAIDDPEVADAISDDFKIIAKMLRRKKCSTKTKSFSNTLKKKAKSLPGPKKVKKSTTTVTPLAKKRATKVKKSAQKRGK